MRYFFWLCCLYSQEDSPHKFQFRNWLPNLTVKSPGHRDAEWRQPEWPPQRSQLSSSLTEVIDPRIFLEVDLVVPAVTAISHLSPATDLDTMAVCVCVTELPLLCSYYRV